MEHVEQWDAKPEYLGVEGVRFDTRISDDIKEDIIERLKRSTELLKNPKGGHYNDIRNYLEHRMIASTADSAIDPLMPYAVISGSKTPEQVKKEREKKYTAGFEKVFRLSELDKLFDMPPELRKNLRTAVESLSERPDRVIVVLSNSAVGENGRCSMPEVKSVKTRSEEIFQAPVGEMKLKEYVVSEGKTVRAVIDDSGWRYDYIAADS